MCSPTRAALLTGRNHHRVGAGVIASLGNDWDGYTGVWPATSASLAKVLGYYGYATSAFGKWHNTPHNETSQVGPFDRWPTGRLIGFDYFYGFLGGETSQWEPRLTENTTHIEPPEHDPKYHLTQDMVDKALKWLDDYQAFSPDKPFFMYWAPGGVHGPHHIFPEWADKYKGKFDDGWDAYRERVYKRQLEMGVIPPGTKLTKRDATMASWESVPENQKAFQLRLMELFAGFVEHTDIQVGRLVAGLENRGLRENTLIFYIFGDNGSSAEGQQGSISELLAQNNIPNTVEKQMAALERIGGLEVPGFTQDRQHVSCWLGLGRRHAFQGDQASGRLLRWNPQSDGGLLAQADQTGQKHALPVPPRGGHRPDDLRDPEHPAPKDGTATTNCPWTASAWPTPLKSRPPARARIPSSLTTTAAGRFTRTAGWPAP
ncbi:MAG: sulfatase-like hydrolase/transferase [Desulfobacterales bacterium]